MWIYESSGVPSLARAQLSWASSVGRGEHPRELRTLGCAIWLLFSSAFGHVGSMSSLRGVFSSARSQPSSHAGIAPVRAKRRISARELAHLDWRDKRAQPEFAVEMSPLVGERRLRGDALSRTGDDGRQPLCCSKQQGFGARNTPSPRIALFAKQMQCTTSKS